MSVLTKIQMGNMSVKDNIMMWLPCDEWISTTQIHGILNRNVKASDVHNAIFSLIKGDKLIAREIMNPVGAPRTEFKKV